MFILWNYLVHVSLIDCSCCRLRIFPYRSIAPYPCACALKRGAVKIHTFYLIYLECTTIRARVANKHFRNLTYLRFLQYVKRSRGTCASLLTNVLHMSHFAYACKMRYPLNLVLESWEYLWFYWTFCIVILDYGLKLHKLLNHTLVMLQKWLEIH